MVATETVVTTSQPRRRKQNLESQNILAEVSVVENDLNVSDSADSSGWTLQVDGLYLDQHPTSRWEKFRLTCVVILRIGKVSTSILLINQVNAG